MQKMQKKKICYCCFQFMMENLNANTEHRDGHPEVHRIVLVVVMELMDQCWTILIPVDSYLLQDLKKKEKFLDHL